MQIIHNTIEGFYSFLLFWLSLIMFLFLFNELNVAVGCYAKLVFFVRMVVSAKAIS